MTNLIRLINLTGKCWEAADGYNPDVRDVMVVINHIITIAVFFAAMVTFLASPFSLLDWGWARVIIILVVHWILAINYCKKYDTED